MRKILCVIALICVIAPSLSSAAPITLAFPTTTPEVASSTQDTLTITVITPASILPKDTQYATILITTNRSASCRFGTSVNMEFGRKTAFKNTGGQSHSHEFSHLGNGNLYVYYVQCEDAATLQLTADTTVSFSVAMVSTTASSIYAQLAAITSIIADGELWPAFDPIAAVLRAFGF